MSENYEWKLRVKTVYQWRRKCEIYRDTGVSKNDNVLANRNMFLQTNHRKDNNVPWKIVRHIYF
jgi:hypothetical protein